EDTKGKRILSFLVPPHSVDFADTVRNPEAVILLLAPGAGKKKRKVKEKEKLRTVWHGKISCQGIQWGSGRRIPTKDQQLGL
ncbi:hypothetical protein SK128_024009, partial [Halocaridina rubra]